MRASGYQWLYGTGIRTWPEACYFIDASVCFTERGTLSFDYMSYVMSRSSDTAFYSALSRIAVGMHLARPEVACTTMRLSQPLRIPFGAFHFKLQVPENCRYVIEACTDLKNWQQLAAGTGRANPVDYIDSGAYEFSYRFYRVRSAALFSENVLGYASVLLNPGYSMIANPFVSCQTVSDLFPNWPNGTSLSAFDTAEFRLRQNRVQHDRWTEPRAKLAPGEGVLFYNPTNEYKTITFVGELQGGSQTVSLQPGCYKRSSRVPKPGTLDELGFPAAEGDVVHLFDREKQQYVTHHFENGAWLPGSPMVGVGESFWVAKNKIATWTVKLDLCNLS